MASPAKNAGATKAFVPSCLIARDRHGKLVVLALDDSSDPALALRDSLRKTKGDGKYADVLPIIRGKATRQLHFA